jgi:hypothetical protein
MVYRVDWIQKLVSPYSLASQNRRDLWRRFGEVVDRETEHESAVLTVMWRAAAEISPPLRRFLLLTVKQDHLYLFFLSTDPLDYTVL